MERIFFLISNKELLGETSDYELGALFLGSFIAQQADALGVPSDSISDDLGELIRLYALAQETDKVELMAFEKALHKAAAGDSVKAGSILINALNNGAGKRAIAKEVITLRNKYARWAASGGNKTAETKRNDNRERNSEIRRLRDALIKSGTSERDIASKIAKRHQISPSQVRRILK